MAKKKQTELTIEEKLQNALVPKEEQPYKIPNNWCWTYVSNVMNIVMGQSPKGIDTTQNISDIPLIGGASDMGNLYPIVNKYTKNPTKLSKENDVILSIRATLGRPIFSDGVYCLGRGVAGVSSNYLSKEFIRYYYICFESVLYSNATGTTFLQVTGSVLNKMLIPLPPINEQQRIVNRIESLFTKLDKAKELIENTLAQFEQNKMAILHKAFTGELTVKWRKENNIDLSSWQKYTLNDVCTKITDGTHNSPVNTERGDYMYITAKNIKEDGFDLSKITYVSTDVHEKIYARCNVEFGDVLYIKDGATTGIATVNIFKEPFSLLSSVAVLKPKKEKLVSKYLVYYLNSSEVKSRMINNMSGNAITRLTLTKIKKSEVKLPIVEEQQAIVNILDRIFIKYDKIRDLQTQIDKIELLKKSILAKAFRGELGTNDPNEESAEVLLRGILAEK